MYFEDPHVLMEVTRRPELILFYFLNEYLPGRRSKITLSVGLFKQQSVLRSSKHSYLHSYNQEIEKAIVVAVVSSE